MIYTPRSYRLIHLAAAAAPAEIPEGRARDEVGGPCTRPCLQDPRANNPRTRADLIFFFLTRVRLFHLLLIIIRPNCPGVSNSRTPRYAPFPHPHLATVHPYDTRRAQLESRRANHSYYVYIYIALDIFSKPQTLDDDLLRDACMDFIFEYFFLSLLFLKRGHVGALFICWTARVFAFFLDLAYL
jgi:hypothetical protein